MIASVMMYGAAVAAIIALAAFAVERSCTVLKFPRRIVWMIALVLSVALPIATTSMEHEQHAPQALSGNANYVAPVILADIHSISIGIIPSAIRQPVWPERPNLDNILKVLWFASSLGVLAFYGVGWARLRRAARTWVRESVDCHIVLVADQMGPAVVGFLKPEIVFPRWLLGAPASTRAMILAHERAHITARDPLMVLAALLLIALAPWNLALLWQLRRLRFAVEVDCDARVLRRGVTSSAYGEMLLAVGVHNSKTSRVAIALTEPASQLERRIRALGAKTHWYSKPVAVACAVVSVLLILSCTQLEAPANAAQVAEAQNPEMKHYKSNEWDFELDVPRNWNRFPPVSSNSPFEVTRFLSNENGKHNLIIFRFPYDPKDGLQTVREGTIQTLTKTGFSNFVRGETRIGSTIVPTLNFDRILDGSPWYCRYFYFEDGTLRYVLAFGTTNREGMFPIDDRIAKTFVTTD